MAAGTTNTSRTEDEFKGDVKARTTADVKARSREGYGDDAESIRSLGLDVVTELCDRLLSQGAPGLHFYTMNQAGLTTTIWQRLGL